MEGVEDAQGTLLVTWLPHDVRHVEGPVAFVTRKLCILNFITCELGWARCTSQGRWMQVRHCQVRQGQ
jgi:hypothetical protein